MYNTQLENLMQPKYGTMQKLFFNMAAVTVALFLIATETAVAEDKDLVQLQFEEALHNRDSGKIYDAILMFENILATNPNLNRARLELAVAYHEANRYVDAMEQFKTVLDDPDTPESVRLAILAYIGQLYSDELRPDATHTFSYYARAGLIYNSNINTVPGVGNIIVNGREFFLPSEEIASVGTDIVLSASHRYRRKKPFNIDGAKTIFDWQSQVSLSSNLYTKTSDFNLNVISADTGPAFISAGRWLGALPLRVDQVFLGGSSLATALSVNPYIKFDLGNYRNILLESTFLKRNYADSINDPQNGNLVMAGAGYTTLFKNLNTGVEAGFRFRNRSADDPQFGNNGLTLYFSGFTTLTELSNVYLKGNYRTFDYDAPDTIFGGGLVTRDDNEYTVNIGYNRDFRDGWLGNWTFNTELAYTENSSNIDAYDYDRLLFSANLSRYMQ